MSDIESVVKFLRALPSSELHGLSLFVSGVVLLTISRELYPMSPLGSLLRQPTALVTAFLAWSAISFIVGTWLFGRRRTVSSPADN